MRTPLAVLPLALLASCSFPPLDLSGRECPCIAGWECIAEVCVPRGSVDAGLDASTDAGADTGVAESGTADTGVVDSGAADSGAADTGIVDSGTDTGVVDSGAAPDAGGCHDVVYEVTAANDDGNIEITSPTLGFYPDGDGLALHCGAWEGPEGPGAYAVRCYFRFALPTGLPSSPSLEVRLRLWRAGGSSWLGTTSGYALRVALERLTSPAVVTGTPRTSLTSSIRWPASGPLAWGTSGYVSTPDLAPLFGEVAGSFGPGSHVQVWVDPEDIGTPATVHTPRYAPGEASPAALTLHWCD